MDCYIYYKSKEEHAMEIRHCVDKLRINLVGSLMQAVRLQRRPTVKDGQITWMEIYSEIPENFEEILAQALEKSGMNEVIPMEERRWEYFIDGD